MDERLILEQKVTLTIRCTRIEIECIAMYKDMGEVVKTGISVE